MGSTQIQENPGLSLTRQVSKRVQVLRTYCRDRISASSYLSASLKNTRSLAGSATGRQVLVIANGPSTSTLDPRNVRDAMKGGMDCFAMNDFILTDLSTEITPTYYVLSDPLDSPDSPNERARRIWNRLDEHSTTTLVVPHRWWKVLRARTPTPLFFNDCGLQGWTRNISPMRAMAYMPMTSFKALAFALFLGYEEIFVIGFDNSNFKFLNVNPMNEIYYSGKTHFYSGVDSTLDTSASFVIDYRQGMADCLFDFSMCFYDLGHYFSYPSISNLDPCSLTDVFVKVVDSPLIRQ